MRDARGKTVASVPVPWTGRLAHGLVPGTLEVWTVSLDDGTLSLRGPDLAPAPGAGTVRVPVLPDGTVRLAWSPDGRRFAAEAADGLITVWERGSSAP